MNSVRKALWTPVLILAMAVVFVICGTVTRGTFRNFTFRNITSVNAKKAVDITGLKGLPVHNLLFDGVKFYGTREGMTIDYAEDIVFQNCLITPQQENTIKHSKDLIWNGSPLE